MNIFKRKWLLIIILLVILIALIVIAVWIFGERPSQNESISSVAPASPPPSSSETSTSTTKTYRNEEWRFEFQYPEGWSFHENTFGGPFSKFNLVGASPKENGHPNPIFPSILINIVTLDFADRANISLRNLNASTSVIIIAGIQGTRYDYEFEGVRKIGIDIPFGEYRMLLGAQQSYDEVFNQILASFKFLND